MGLVQYIQLVDWQTELRDGKTRVIHSVASLRIGFDVGEVSYWLAYTLFFLLDRPLEC